MLINMFGRTERFVKIVLYGTAGVIVVLYRSSLEVVSETRQNECMDKDRDSIKNYSY